MNKTLIFVTDSMSLYSGGRVSSIFGRASMFTEMGMKVLVVTKNFRADYLDTFHALCEKNNVDGLEFQNMYRFFAEEELYRLHDNSRELAASYQGDVRSPSPNVRLTYNADGELVRKQVYREPVTEDEVNLAGLEYYIPGSGRLYLRGIPDPTEGIREYRWIRKNGEEKVFTGLSDMFEYWISELDRIYDHPCFMVESMDHPDAFANNRYMNRRLCTVATLHSIFLKRPYDSTAPVNIYHGTMLSHASAYSAIVVLTEQEKTDVYDYFGANQNVFCIPHPYRQAEAVPSDRTDSADGKKHIVTISRLMELKRLDHAILAMKDVLKEIPDSELDIYGSGPEEEHLADLIRENHLENSVRLMGHTTEPLKIMSGSDLLLSTSYYEGFGLAIQESLSVKTPVVAYDYRYGPRMMIKDGKNGYIVKNGDIHALSEGIIRALNTEWDRDDESIWATVDNDDIKERWRRLFDYIDQNEVAENYSDKPDIRAVKLIKGKAGKQLFSSNVKWKLSIDVQLRDMPEELPEVYLNYMDSRRFDIDDKLYSKGQVQKGGGNDLIVDFDIRYPQADYEAVIGHTDMFRLDVVGRGTCRRVYLPREVLIP